MKDIYLKFLALIIFVSIAGMANAQLVRYVKPTATGTGDGLTWANATANLQAMITASASGDEVWVAAGTYLPTTLAGDGTDLRDVAFVMKSGVKIYGGFIGTETLLSARNATTNVTILSGDIGTPNVVTDNAFHVVIAAGALSTAVLDGFTITGGNANGSNTTVTITGTLTVNRGHAGGISVNATGNDVIFTNLRVQFNRGGRGAMYCLSASPTISSSTFSNNTSDFNGGALYCFAASPNVTNVTFTSNTATLDGGAVFLTGTTSNPTFTDVTFTSNSGVQGGAIYGNTSTQPVFTNVLFDANTATNRAGAFFALGSNPVFTNSTFRNNISTSTAGAVYISSSDPTFRNVNFSGNTAGTSGGAIFIFGTNAATSSDPIFTNTLFYNNVANNAINGGGGAIYVSQSSNVTISGATFYQNDSKFDGGAIFTAFSSSVMGLSNSILFGNTATNATKDIQNGGTGNLTVRNSITQIATTGVGNIVGDPLFTSVLPANSSFLRLDATSPGINAGDNTLLTAGVSTDFAGNTRIFDTTIDMGIYERQTTLPVELASFTAQKQNNSAVIKWVTLSEKNNAYFSLLKSNDGKTFSPVTKILPQGNGTSTASYSFVDHSPSNGVNYYQLVQIDNDGTKKDYGVKFLTFSLENELVKLYPNPTTDIVNVFISNKDYDTATLLAIDGKVLSTNSLTAGVNTALSLQDFPKGVYVVKLTGAKGVQIKKIIKL
jgi:predicted outer membrane repeat protein